MHSLETLERLNTEAAERELAREYGRERARVDIGPRWIADGDRSAAAPERLARLRARLLAVAASLMALGCASAVRPSTPDIAGPCPPPPALRLVHHETMADGSVVLVLVRRTD